MFCNHQFVCSRELIEIVESRDIDEDKRPVWIGYTYTVLLFLFGLLRSVFYHCSFNNMIVTGLSVRTALIGAIYRKVISTSM